MRLTLRVAVLCACAGVAAGAQQRPMTRADSIEKARADSIALLRALQAATPTPAPQQGQPGPTNPRMLPDISAVGDLVADLSPNGSTQEDLSRFGVREVELAIQAVVDPYFRGDFFLGFNNIEGVSIEQAYMTATGIPDLELRLGRYLMPFGKLNTTHRHDLHTVEYPWVIQRFLSPDALKGTGAYVSKVFAPFGWYQELIVTAVDRLSEPPEGLITLRPVNKDFGGLGFSARLRNYWDINQATNLEVSASALTGKIEQPLDPPGADFNAVPARQSDFGADLTFRWRPLQQGLYESFMLQSEIMRQVNEKMVNVPNFAGPQRDFTGGYVYARYQIGQRLFLGARYDHLQDPVFDGRTLRSGSGYLEWYPSEFSKLVAAYERVNQAGLRAEQLGLEGVNRILLQASFALGPHRPHPF